MPELVDDATLALTELIANVVRHVPGRHCEVRMLRQEHGVRVEVADAYPRLPQVRTVPGAGEPPGEGGRGLVLLAAVVDRWAVEPRTDGSPGKCVWFECDASGKAHSAPHTAPHAESKTKPNRQHTSPN
jgi:anti-sigma regulatory factor (Ser/Thr protein kinase)